MKDRPPVTALKLSEEDRALLWAIARDDHRSQRAAVSHWLDTEATRRRYDRAAILAAFRAAQAAKRHSGAE